MKVAIIGGGLAGCSLAFALKQAGLEPVVYEAGPSLASAASGNVLGLYNPRFTAERTAESDFYASAYSLGLRTFRMFDDIDWNPCGALHLIVDDKKNRRFPQTVKNWGWESEHMQILNAEQASEKAGVALNYDALYLPDSGTVSPQKLCEAYMRDVDFHLNAPVESIAAAKKDTGADVVVVACAGTANGFEGLAGVPLSTIRGQVTQVQVTPVSEKLQCNLCYGGYLTVAKDGKHILGSTFQRWLDHSDIIADDDKDNLEKLSGVVPELAEGFKVVGHRASVRVSSKDHFPVVGPVPEQDNVYVSVAHGSHGILTSLASAYLITDMIVQRPLLLANNTVAALSPERFKADL